MSYMRTRFITFIWMFTLGQCLTSKFINQDNNRVIIIDEDGTSDQECCMYGKCHCSTLSLALQHIQDNTEVRIQSSISLHDVVTFGNVSNVKITGNNSPTVRCDHQGGLVGRNINYIVIQGITWDTCNGITMLSFTDGAHITECNFMNFINVNLTLHGLGLATINGCAFSQNTGSVDVLAPSIIIHGSKFYGNSEDASLFIDVSNFKIAYHGIINVSVENCKFSGNSGHSVHCIGSVGVVPKLSILSSNFTDNANTAVNVEHCNITLNSVTFSNNVNAGSGHINDGGAVRVYNSTVNMTGNILFYHNRAGNNGGAVYLDHSVLFATQGSILFHNNTADNGGAIFIGENSKLNVTFSEESLNFSNNSATSNGGILYVDLHLINDAFVIYQLGNYYYNLLNYYMPLYFDDYGNTAFMGSWAYLNISFLDSCFPVHDTDSFASSSPCRIYSSYYDSSTVFGNVTNINYSNSFDFWLHDLKLSVTVVDHFGNYMGPVNASFWCCDNSPVLSHNCTIDSDIDNFTVTSNDSIIKCSSTDAYTITCTAAIVSSNHYLLSSDIYVTMESSKYSCNDIVHVYTYDNGLCLPICFHYSVQKHCTSQHILPGYWYDNGYIRYVTTCPIGHCNLNLVQYYYSYYPYDGSTIFPDRDFQCNDYWRGLACGECNYSAGYAIKYDTIKCVPVHECLHTSVAYSLLILFGVSLIYWIVIISFIFVLLHFKFDITAGYAYGLLFYYSVLEQLVNDVIYNATAKFSNIADSINYDVDNEYIGDDLYESMRLSVLPFLSSIGNLKPPFTGFMKLCFGEAEMIDHLMLGYMHPLIVTLLVVIVFILARNFVLVARTVGRYVNSKSICILLLLSYSSITYTSMQLLKPLIVFDHNIYYYDEKLAIQTYWSPTVQYFHGHHLWYGIIAILCEIIIGVGIPLVLIFQRYLSRYCNINLLSIKHIIDQLKGCYKDKYHWFVAYYLICRQVLLGVNNLIDYCNGFWPGDAMMPDTPFSKFTIMLAICILMMTIHVWFQPYKSKGLNILDSFILLTLVGLLVSALENYWNRMIAVVFWFLPLLILINYLAYSTKLKYFIIPFSCAAIFGTTFYFVRYFGVFAVLFLASSFIIFLIYIIHVLKYLCARCCKRRPRYVAINEQNDEVDENNDNNIIEVDD